MKKERIITAKFGGSSLADAAQFRKVKQIIQEDPDRRYIVPSAPGKRNRDDEKVTDLLYRCYEEARSGQPYQKTYEKIKNRYEQIIEELQLPLSLEKEFEKIERAFLQKAGEEYAASRGEYLNGKILAAYLEIPFLDAAEVIRFNMDGVFEEERTDFLLRSRLKTIPRAVIPGFYGGDDAGNIHTFSRGGSDVTGAIVSRAAEAQMYENWTDVPGFLLADPSIIKNPKKIDAMSFEELRELSYRGAAVLHEEAVYPARKSGIPIHIRNTNRPQEQGTIISRYISPENMVPITGIAGKKQFAAISIMKNRMNEQVGFCKRLLEAFEENEIAFEHMPSGVDTISVILPLEEYRTKKEKMEASLAKHLKPDRITVDEDLAMVTVVGKGMRSVSGIAARFFSALGAAGVNIKMIDMGSNEVNCTIGVRNEDFEPAVEALYCALSEV